MVERKLSLSCENDGTIDGLPKAGGRRGRLSLCVGGDGIWDSLAGFMPNKRGILESNWAPAIDGLNQGPPRSQAGSGQR